MGGGVSHRETAAGLLPSPPPCFLWTPPASRAPRGLVYRAPHLCLAKTPLEETANLFCKATTSGAFAAAGCHLHGLLLLLEPQRPRLYHGDPECSWPSLTHWSACLLPSLSLCPEPGAACRLPPAPSWTSQTPQGPNPHLPESAWALISTKVTPPLRLRESF